MGRKIMGEDMTGFGDRRMLLTASRPQICYRNRDDIRLSIRRFE